VPLRPRTSRHPLSARARTVRLPLASYSSGMSAAACSATNHRWSLAGLKMHPSDGSNGGARTTRLRNQRLSSSAPDGTALPATAATAPAALPRMPLGSSGVMVTEVCLGTMTWGTRNTEAEAHEQLDYAVKVRGQGLTLVLISAQLELFGPPCHPT